MKLQFDRNEQFKITLPKQIILAKGWRKGDSIAVVLDEIGNLVLKNNNKEKQRAATLNSAISKNNGTGK